MIWFALKRFLNLNVMTDRSQAPRITPFADIRLDFPQQQTLSCGIPIWIVDGGDEEVCQLSVYVAGGTMHDSQPLLSMLTSQMCLEGSEHYAALDIAEQLDYYGAWKTSQSHDQMSQLSLSSMTECYPRLLPIVVDGLAHAVFPESEFEVYKQRYAASYATLRDRVKYLAAVELRRLYYGAGHPLVADVDPHRLLQLTTGDLKQFYRQYYHPSNCVIILAGRVTDQMLQVTDDAFGQWHDEHDSKVAPLPWDIKPADEMLSIVDKPGAIQAAVSMAIQAIGRNHPDYLALRVLCTVLGGYFGSRLMSNIREDKGYTYGINAFLSGREQDGFVGVTTECDVHYTWQLIDEVKFEMQRLREQLIPEAELALVRQYMLSDQVKTLDTPFSLASYVASTLLYGVYPEYFNRQIETILNITPQRLQQVAQAYLDLDRLRIVIAGDKSQL